MRLPAGYAIRPYQPGDEAALSAITLAAIRHIGARHYSHEQIKAWGAGHQLPERFAQRAQHGAIILAAIAGPVLPVAFTLLEFDSEGSGHLDMLYCDPRHTRQGLAEALLARAEECARYRHAPSLYTEASEAARPVFERVGYKVLHRRDFTVQHENRVVPIHNYAMEKPLD